MDNLDRISGCQDPLMDTVDEIIDWIKMHDEVESLQKRKIAELMERLAQMLDED